MKAAKVKELISLDEYRDRLIDIYGVNNYSSQKARYINALNGFIEIYGDLDISIISAPGRSEISGNHTDHQGGQVLAASINLDSIAVVSKCVEGIATVYSEGYDKIDVSLDELEISEKEYQTTRSLIKGVLYYLKELGYPIGGFKAYVTSDVLSGSGLSSSASFEALIGNIISSLYNNSEITPVEIAKVGQKAENIYFAKPCGLMDQVACSLGNLVHIDFKDPDDPFIESIDYDFSKSGYSLCIVDVNASHADLTDDYAYIPLEMKKIAKVYEKEYLSQIDEDKFYQDIARLRPLVGDRAILRAHHYFSENRRVEIQAECLKRNDFTSFLKLVKESGESSFKYLQNIYTVNNYKEQAVSLALALSELYLKGNGVARVHGGGFAGTILVFVKNEYVQDYRNKIEEVFGKGSCHVLNIRKYGGIKVL